MHAQYNTHTHTHTQERAREKKTLILSIFPHFSISNIDDHYGCERATEEKARERESESKRETERETRRAHTSFKCFAQHLRPRRPSLVQTGVLHPQRHLLQHCPLVLELLDVLLTRNHESRPSRSSGLGPDVWRAWCGGLASFSCSFCVSICTFVQLRQVN